MPHASGLDRAATSRGALGPPQKLSGAGRHVGTPDTGHTEGCLGRERPSPGHHATLTCLPGSLTRSTRLLRGWTMPLEKSLDMLADLGMTGRIGMDAVQQQMPIGLVGSPGTEEINIGDHFFARGPLDRRI